MTSFSLRDPGIIQFSPPMFQCLSAVCGFLRFQSAKPGLHRFRLPEPSPSWHGIGSDRQTEIPRLFDRQAARLVITRTKGSGLSPLVIPFNISSAVSSPSKEEPVLAVRLSGQFCGERVSNRSNLITQVTLPFSTVEVFD